ncbi:MAG: alpha/beta fold hydrolase [Pseudomonadota bacterium]
MQLIAWAYDTRDGFTLRGWHTPPSGKPLIHFIHGNGFCARAYEPMLRALSKHFDLWLSDVQGHGDSDAGERFVGWNRCADLAVEAFKHHQHDLFGAVSCFGLGHSFGGVLTCLAMAEHPRLFKRTVLLDPVLFPAMMVLGLTLAESTGLAKHTPLARAALRRRTHWPDRESAMDGLRGRGTYKGWTEEALRAFVDHAIKDQPDGQVELKCHPTREAAIFSSGPVGLWSSLRRVHTPTLLIHGHHTFPFVISSAQLWSGSNAAVTVEAVDGGHCFMQEHPADTAARVTEFLLSS